MILAAGLAGLALVVVCGPRGRPSAPRGGARADRRRARSVARRERSPDLAGVLHAVAAHLRAGADPGAAWGAVLGTSTATPAALRAALAGSSRMPGRGAAASAHGRVLAAVAAARVADELGAPLAAVLEGVARTIALDEEDEGDLRAALAGPRATARLLAWLPLLGLALAAALGAHPLTILLGGGLGTGAGVLGGGLAIVGRWWTVRLVSRAGRPGRS